MPDIDKKRTPDALPQDGASQNVPSPHSLLPDEGEILRYLGVRNGGDEELLTQISAEIERCQRVARPAYRFRIFDIAASADGIVLSGSALILTGNDMQREMKNAAQCAVLAATLGMETERALVRLSRTDPKSAVIFDAVCTEMTEQTANRCEAEIRAHAEKNNFRCGFRFSPGYGDFPLSVQKVLLDAIDAPRRLGIRLTDSDLMIPTKSVTAVIGLIRN